MMHGKTQLRSACVWLATIFIVASLARAHDPGLSTAVLKVRPDRLEAEVVFARTDIARGEIVAVKGGHVLTNQQWKTLEPSLGSAEIQPADLFAEFEQLVAEYVEQADVIVYVPSSTSPLSMRTVSPPPSSTLSRPSGAIAPAVPVSSIVVTPCRRPASAGSTENRPRSAM